MKAKNTSKSRLKGSAMAGGWSLRPRKKKKGKDCEDPC